MAPIVVDSDARVIGELYRKVRSSAVDAIYHAIECGRMLKAKKQSMAHGKWLRWLRANNETLGFKTDRTARLLMRFATNRKSTSDLTEVQATKLLTELWGNSNKPHHRTEFTGQFEWYTPAKYIEAARVVLGAIDLDPASSIAAQQIVQAEKFFTIDDNGLEFDWYGRIWLNPPYSQPLIDRFVGKLLGELDNGRTLEAILLTNNFTDTEWFHRAERVAASICFTKGRVRFVDPAGDRAAPTQGQAFFYFGPHAQRFIEVFGEFGFLHQHTRYPELGHEPFNPDPADMAEAWEEPRA